MEEIINLTSIIGCSAFAVSGALVALRNKLDPFGVIIIAFATATGGGTLRDILLEGKDVFWLAEPIYIWVIFGATVVAILFRKKLIHIQKALMLFDTIGLALYTIIGVQIGIDREFSAVACIILGTITGAFGGVVRDILVNEIPVIFKKEIYATVSILGGIIYLTLFTWKLPSPYVQLIPISLIIILRSLVVYFDVALPSLYGKEEKV